MAALLADAAAAGAIRYSYHSHGEMQAFYARGERKGDAEVWINSGEVVGPSTLALPLRLLLQPPSLARERNADLLISGAPELVFGGTANFRSAQNYSSATVLTAQLLG